MAPEQAKGKTADRRSDIWSFGVILYEVLTGKRLFRGETTVETIGSVLNIEPDISAASPRVHSLLRWCLEKDRKQRLASISDARRQLNDDGGAEFTAQSAPPSRSGFGWFAWVGAALLLIAAASLALVHFREKPNPQPILRYSVAVPESSFVHSFAISPDGRALVIAAIVNGKSQLWLRPLDALQAKPMPFTEEATYPFWSPDSRWIGFFAQNKLKKIAASGGPSQSLCEAPYSRGGSWNRDNIIVFSPANGEFALQRVAASGGVPTAVTRIKGDYRHPIFLPDGRHFLYLALGSLPETSGVYVSSLDGNENRRVLAEVSEAIFARPAHGEDSGHILFVREGNLMARSFDAENAQAAGEEFLVAEGINITTNQTYAPVSISDDGVLLYASGAGGGRVEQIVWYDRAGNPLNSVAAGAIRYPAISPDEKIIAFQRLSSNTASDLWLRDDRGSEARFTTDVSANATPFWSPKGDHIVFASNRKGGVYNLYRKATNGNGKEKDELLLETGNAKFPYQWSRDGRFIVYTEADPKTKQDIWVLPVEGSAAPGSDETKALPFVHTEFNEVFGQLSR
jgi:Tol biopolymer transport system component